MSTLKLLGFAFVILLAIFASLYIGAGDLKPSVVKGFVESYGAWSPAIYLLLTLLAAITPLPNAPITMAGGALFGWFYALIYTLVGMLVGGMVAFFTARFLGEESADRFMRHSNWKEGEEYKELVEKNSFYGVFLLRLLPFMPFTVVSALLGLTKINLSTFFVASVVGIIPSIFAYSYFGQSLFELSLSNLIIATTILVLLSLPAYFKERIQKFF